MACAILNLPYLSPAALVDVRIVRLATTAPRGDSFFGDHIPSAAQTHTGVVGAYVTASWGVARFLDHISTAAQEVASIVGTPEATRWDSFGLRNDIPIAAHIHQRVVARLAAVLVLDRTAVNVADFGKDFPRATLVGQIVVRLLATAADVVSKLQNHRARTASVQPGVIGLATTARTAVACWFGSNISVAAHGDLWVVPPIVASQLTRALGDFLEDCDKEMNGSSDYYWRPQVRPCQFSTVLNILLKIL